MVEENVGRFDYKEKMYICPTHFKKSKPIEKVI